MCIAIGLPANKAISKETLKNCHEANKDGCGFAFIDKTLNQIRIFKSLQFDPFYEEFAKVREDNPDSDMLVHFRIKTHGEISLDNCHPFHINEQMAFIHNGVIRNVPDCPEKKKSDTQMFNEHILKQLPEGWESSSGVKLLIEEMIGYSKLVVLHKEKGLIYYNENKGSWDEGIWYSNSSYKKSSYSSTSSSTSYYYNRGHDYTKEQSYCKQCHKNITNNIYSINQKEGFCSSFCKSEYTESACNFERCDWCNTFVQKRLLLTTIVTTDHGPISSNICNTCLDDAIELQWLSPIDKDIIAFKEAIKAHITQERASV